MMDTITIYDTAEYLFYIPEFDELMIISDNKVRFGAFNTKAFSAYLFGELKNHKMVLIGEL